MSNTILIQVGQKWKHPIWDDKFIISRIDMEQRIAYYILNGEEKAFTHLNEKGISIEMGPKWKLVEDVILINQE